MISVLGLIGFLLCAGVLLWAVYALPIDAQIQAIIRVVIIVVCCLGVITWMFRFIHAGGFNFFVQ